MPEASQGKRLRVDNAGYSANIVRRGTAAAAHHAVETDGRISPHCPALHVGYGGAHGAGSGPHAAHMLPTRVLLTNCTLRRIPSHTHLNAPHHANLVITGTQEHGHYLLQLVPAPRPNVLCGICPGCLELRYYSKSLVWHVQPQARETTDHGMRSTSRHACTRSASQPQRRNLAWQIAVMAVDMRTAATTTKRC